jgi:hypothetical protein
MMERWNACGRENRLWGERGSLAVPRGFTSVWGARGRVHASDGELKTPGYL